MILIAGAVALGVVLGLGGLVAYLNYRQAALFSQPPQHGTAFVLEADLSKAHGDTNVLATLKEAVRKRFWKLGVRIFWEPISETRIRVVAPIVENKDADAARDFIIRGGMLEFRLVHDESDQLVERGEVPPDYEVLQLNEMQRDSRKRIELLVVKKKPALTGSAIKSAMVVHDNLGEPQILFALNPQGTAAFAEVTRENVGRRLAIVLDGKLYSAPVIQGPIEAGRGQITGRFDAQEAFRLANLLDCPLPVPITVLESKTY